MTNFFCLEAQLTTGQRSVILISFSLQTRDLIKMLSVQDGALLRYHVPGIVCVCVYVHGCACVWVCACIYWNALLQRQAWSGHRRECKSLRSLLPRIPTDSVRLAARLIFALVCLVLHCQTHKVLGWQKLTMSTFSLVGCNEPYIVAVLWHICMFTWKIKSKKMYVLKMSPCSCSNKFSSNPEHNLLP